MKNLNIQQQEAKGLILKYINNPIGTFGLLGAGGTGKTYLITSIENSDDFLFLAPTNKAVNVLRNSLRRNGILKPNVKTIDSYFKFKIIKDENNQSQYSYSTPKIEDIPDVIVVDEVSMLRNKHVDLLLNITEKKALILIGDDMQIPPVLTDGEKEDEVRNDKGFRVSKAFTVMDKTYTLTVQNRQKESSDLFKLINAFRENMSKPINYKRMATIKANGQDIKFLYQHSQELNNIIKENDCVAVSFKNMTTDLFNYKIGMIKSNDPSYNFKKINEGDYVVFDKFYRNGDVTFYTSEKVKVNKIQMDIVSIEVPFYEKPITHIQDFAICENEIGFNKIVWLKNDELRKKVYQKVYNKRNSLIELMNLGDAQVKKDLIKLNTFYNDFLNGFAKLKKPYAITSHKSQGSTFDHVIIPLYDFYLINEKDRNQLFYVAMSRASKGIIFVEGWCNFNKSNRRILFHQEEKYLIAGTQNYKCKMCSNDLTDGKFDIDHITRLEDNGTNEINNLQALCKSCHKQKTKIDKKND